MRTGGWVAIGLGALAVGALVLARRDDEDEGEATGGDPAVKIEKPMAVGERTDPSVAPLLAQIAARYIGAGIDLERTDPWAHVVMSKAPLVDGPDPDDDATRPGAIPPLSMWPNLVSIAANVDQVISQSTVLRANPPRQTGYRPVDYNARVGGAPGSKHLVAGAIDAWVPIAIIAAGGAALKAYREELRMAFARHVVSHPSVGWGFGVYTNDIHLDNVRRSGAVITWEHGAEYIAKARKQLGIA